VSEGLTAQELLDLFDRTAGQPLIRAAIQRTLRPSEPPNILDLSDPATVERLARAMVVAMENATCWGTEKAAAIIAALREPLP